MCYFQQGRTGCWGSPGGWIYGLAGILGDTGSLVRSPGGECGCWASHFLSQPQGGCLHPEGFCASWMGFRGACRRAPSLCDSPSLPLPVWVRGELPRLLGGCHMDLWGTHSFSAFRDEWEGNKSLPMALGVVHSSIYGKREPLPKSPHCNIYKHPLSHGGVNQQEALAKRPKFWS